MVCLVLYTRVMSNTEERETMNTITETFTAEEAKTADRVWIVNTDTDSMFAVKVEAANSRIITVEFHGRKIVFTPGYGEWRTTGYQLAIASA
jgi:hypothetical protein